MSNADRVDFAPVTFQSFHPDWETIDSAFWRKRVLLFIFAAVALYLLIYWGYSAKDYSQMPATFANPIHLIEFCLWAFNTFFFLEMWQIALHKTQTTRIKYELSKNEEMRVSIKFNRSFGILFVCIFFYYFLKLIFRYIFDFSLPNSNIFKVFDGDSDPFQTAFAAVEVILGFGAYSQFIYVFEKTVQGRKYPIFWIIPLIGVSMMILLDYKITVFTIEFTRDIVLSVPMYYFSMFFALLGGIIVPVLYFVMGKRFSFAGKDQVSQDCYRKGWGFALMAIAAIFNLNYDLIFVQAGGIALWAEIAFMIFLAPIFTFVGFLFVRSAYRPRG